MRLCGCGGVGSFHLRHTSLERDKFILYLTEKKKTYLFTFPEDVRFWESDDMHRGQRRSIAGSFPTRAAWMEDYSVQVIA